MIEFVAGLGLVLLVLSESPAPFSCRGRPSERSASVRCSAAFSFRSGFKATERIKSTRSRQTARASLAPLLIILALLFWVALDL